MSELQTNQQVYEDEIDLRELFIAMWKNKYIIIAVTLTAAILTGLFSVFMLSPVYQTKLDIVISMPELYHTRYGDYTLPISSNDQYINLITSNNVLINTIKDMGYDSKAVPVEGLKKRISVGSVDPKAVKQNTFTVTISANNPDESLRLAQSLYANYIEFIDIMTKERAVNYYYNYFSIDLKSQQLALQSKEEILKSNEELLSTIPQTINQKSAMQEIEGQLLNSTDYVVLENIVNQNYVDIEKDIITTKQEINTIQDSIRAYTGFLNEIDKEKKAIAQYYSTGDTESYASSIISVVETSVYLPSQPVAPTQKTSPSNARNAAIGGVIGLMMAVMLVFVKEFWFQQEDEKAKSKVEPIVSPSK